MRHIAILLFFTFSLSIFNSHAESELGPVFPMVSDKPKAKHKMDKESFLYFEKVLRSSKMASHMYCEMKVDLKKELRTYKSGTKWIEYLEIDYLNDNRYAGISMNLKIPESSMYGLKVSNNKWSAEGEDVVIEVGDYYDHWIRFTHDGKGRIVQLTVGNSLSFLPCMVKN